MLINWFHENCMQANPDKFQAIIAGERIFEKKLVLFGLYMRILTLLMKNFWTKQKFLPSMLDDSQQWLYKLSRF